MTENCIKVCIEVHLYLTLEARLRYGKGRFGGGGALSPMGIAVP